MTRSSREINRQHAREVEKAYQAFRPTMLRYLTARVGSPQDAQDIAQEGYLRLLRVSDPELIDKLEGYLFRIVTNLANEHLFRQGRSLEALDLETLMERGGDGDGRQGEERLEALGAIQKLDQVLDKLPPLYRAILLLRKRDGYSHAEIAERVGKSKATVHVYLTRAILRCRELWEE
jgi:RNA polymerase sigma factor (sigma-70 family)